MNKEQKLVWDRLKYVKPKHPQLDPEAIRAAFMRGARSMGKSTLAFQSLGRALRDINDKV